MDTAAFLKQVMPSGGLKIMATPHAYERDGKRLHGWRYKSFEYASQLAEAALQADSAGGTVYFAVHGYGDWYEDSTGKRRLRTQDNVKACRSLYDDFDVDPGDPKKYTTREEALADIIKLAQALRLTPTITSSGGGYHCYFSLDADIDPETWMDLAARKRDITTHLGMKVDRAVDMDSARILRPVGTHNRKTDTPRQVTLVKEGRAYTLETMRAALGGYMQTHAVLPAAHPAKGKIANPFAAALGEYPPSSARKVAEHCAALKTVAETAGAVDEPVWRAMIGTVKHCIEGDALCHEWSKGDPRYDATQCQEKIDRWGTGPTSCDEFDKYVACKKACPHAKTTTHPIKLGYEEQAASASEPADDPMPAAPVNVPVIEGVAIPYWPDNGLRWNGAALSRSIVDADGVVHWRPFCRSFIYPANRIRTEDGTWALLLRAKERNGGWREFLMPTSDLAASEMMAKTLAQREIFLFGTKNARADMAEYLVGLTERLQSWRIETRTYEQFGWTEDYSGFVMGTKMLRADKEESVLCGPGVPSDIATDFGTSGTLEEWVSNIDRMFNRKGAEIMQFIMCHAIGSPLVELMCSSNWHGIPITLVGETGHGKSTISKIACGFYGQPKLFEKQGSEDGATIPAAIKRISVMGALPTVLDEMSGRKPEELTRLGYALANGRDKERLRANGTFATIGGEWFKNSIANSNDSVHETLGKLPAGYKTEATQLRFFEIAVPTDYLSTVFTDIDKNFVEHHMDHVYGHACRPFLSFVIQNRDWVRRQLIAARAKYNPRSQEDSKERFYTDCIITAFVAGKIAQKLGLLQFDMKNMRDWAFEHVKILRGNRKASQTDIGEHLAAFVSTLRGRLIVTKHYNDGRAKHREVPLENLMSAPVGRVATEDKRVFITIKAVGDWCKENNVTPSAMRDELDRKGYLIQAHDGQFSHKVYIGSGTTMPSTQARCYELNYSAFYGDGVALRVIRPVPGADAQGAAT